MAKKSKAPRLAVTPMSLTCPLCGADFRSRNRTPAPRRKRFAAAAALAVTLLVASAAFSSAYHIQDAALVPLALDRFVVTSKPAADGAIVVPPEVMVTMSLKANPERRPGGPVDLASWLKQQNAINGLAMECGVPQQLIGLGEAVSAFRLPCLAPRDGKL
jgi:hypothetical protein